MGRHSGRRAWSDLAPQEKADSFDAQLRQSAEHAEVERAARRGPYCYDHLIEKGKDHGQQQRP